MPDLLVTLAQAKAHLRLPTDVTADDADLQLKLEVAQELVLDYVAQRVDDADDWSATVAAWDEDTVPKRVQQAILLQFAELWRFRGDDDPDDQPGQWKAQVQDEIGMLSPAITRLLYRLRDPAIS